MDQEIGSVSHEQVSKLFQHNEEVQRNQFNRLYDKIDDNMKEQRKRDELQDNRLTRVEGRVDVLEDDKGQRRKTYSKFLWWALGIFTVSGGVGAFLRFIMRVKFLGGRP